MPSRRPDIRNDEGRVAAAPESNHSADNRRSIPRHPLRRYSPAHVRFVVDAAARGALSQHLAAQSLLREAHMLLDEVAR
jgi:hypothetical protein